MRGSRFIGAALLGVALMGRERFWISFLTIALIVTFLVVIGLAGIALGLTKVWAYLIFALFVMFTILYFAHRRQ